MKRVRGSIAICAAWIAYALAEAVQYHAQWSTLWPDLTFLASAQILTLRAVTIWIPLTFGFLWFARRVPVTHDLWPRGVLKLAAVLAAALIWQGTMEWLSDPLIEHLYHGWREVKRLPLIDYLLQSVHQYHTRVYVIILVCYVWLHLRTAHENRMRIAELERGVTHARLDALSASMQPRFLFDALDVIANLAHRDPAAADRTLMSLSSLLRFNLAGNAHEVTVAQETTLAADWFAIERARTGDDFDVRWSVDPDCDDALVPALVVQELAELALGHARVPLRVAVRRHHRRLSIDVGTLQPVPDAGDAAPPTLVARLSDLYGIDHRLLRETGADGRRRVVLDLPWRSTAAEIAP
jgi:hypothetical protein